METLYNELLENCFKDYLHSEEGQKAILLSLAAMLNQKNLEIADKFLNHSTTNYKHIWKDVKHISQETENILKSQKVTTVKKCKVMCSTILKISNLLSDYETKFITASYAKMVVDKVYKDVAVLGIEGRKMTKEEFLELPLDYEENQAEYNTPYFPPERSDESKLVKFGYSVSQNSRLSNKARQELLQHLIESKEVSKRYVISYLEHLIAINGKKKSNHTALEKWKSDLAYVLKL